MKEIDNNDKSDNCIDDLVSLIDKLEFFNIETNIRRLFSK